ncbi:MAG: cytochrome c peroxidase [Hyphomicrobium sp.]|jgi:cytochrome c peroxidase
MTSELEKTQQSGLAWRATRTPVLLAASAMLTIALAGYVVGAGNAAEPPIASKQKLGRALFGDVNLSKNRTQACVSCHSPNLAFTDPRSSPGVGGAVSLGDDGTSLGERNTPTATYASFAPDFHINAKGKAVGGLFLDGRAKNLEEQAGGPPLNPIEMGMPDKASIVARLKENPDYVAAFNALYANGVLDDAEKGYAAMTAAIAAFERTPEFAPFDSKYDRYLRGEVKLTDQEELGRVLFFSSQFTNCSQCHKLNMLGGSEKEVFTNFEYHNIGVPVNHAVHAANGKPADRGLAANSTINDDAQNQRDRTGKFKVPTLRNVAVTAPYMHNGVFNDLRTVILFYDKYNSKSPKRQINPETKQPWEAPEVPDNISIKELEIGPGLDDRRIDALVAFLKTLTDKRYEQLVQP